MLKNYNCHVPYYSCDVVTIVIVIYTYVLHRPKMQKNQSIYKGTTLCAKKFDNTITTLFLGYTNVAIIIMLLFSVRPFFVPLEKKS